MSEQLCRAGANLSLLDKVKPMDIYQYSNIDKPLCLQKEKSVYDIGKSYSPTMQFLSYYGGSHLISIIV